MQLNLPEIIADDIISWGHQNIRDSELFVPPEDYIHGREEEPHVTVLYGIHSELPYETIKLVADTVSFDVKLKFVSIFTNNLYFDVVKIDAVSQSLSHLNKLLKTNVDNTQHFETYSPHVTIAYVKKGRCANLNLLERFFNTEWRASSLIFSSKAGERIPIRLK